MNTVKIMMTMMVVIDMKKTVRKKKKMMMTKGSSSTPLSICRQKLDSLPLGSNGDLSDPTIFNGLVAFYNAEPTQEQANVHGAERNLHMYLANEQ